MPPRLIARDGREKHRRQTLPRQLRRVARTTGSPLRATQARFSSSLQPPSAPQLSHGGASANLRAFWSWGVGFGQHGGSNYNPDATCTTNVVWGGRIRGPPRSATRHEVLRSFRMSSATSPHFQIRPPMPPHSLHRYCCQATGRRRRRPLRLVPLARPPALCASPKAPAKSVSSSAGVGDTRPLAGAQEAAAALAGEWGA